MLTQAPPHTIEIFLQPGGVYFGGRDTQIRTLLGSCVAVTMWHPESQTGGMCHFLLPTRNPPGARCHGRIREMPIHFPSRRANDAGLLDGKYADEALELMFCEVQRNGARAGDYQIKLFGGGNMFPSIPLRRGKHVGQKNVEIVSQLLAHHGLRSSADDLGGLGHRNLIFDIGTGSVWMRHQLPTQSQCGICEALELCPHA